MSGVNRRTFLSCLHADLSSFDTADKKSPFADPRAVAATLLRESIFKKLEDPNSRADANAIAKFLTVNKRCEAFKLVASSTWDEEVIGSVKKTLCDFLHPNGMPLIDSYDHMFQHGALGPGASILGGGGDFYTKMFSSVLSTTSQSLYSSYRSSLRNIERWYHAERHRFSTENGFRLVEGNRLSCVPKNCDISRTICTEPTLNMWYQLGCGNILRRRLGQFFGIDLETVADVNRRMAYLGSKTDDGEDSFSTIDLESASDSISLGLVNELFPKWFSELLKDLRSPRSRLPDGSTLELQMVSTMGNGFTFPLQTLIFSAVVAAVYAEMGIPRLRVDSGKPNWSVFGDDIVVCSKAHRRVSHVLGLLGFSVNADKSFFEGPFRESCGYDFFRGHYVRGVYIKALNSPRDVYVAFNKLVRWSAGNRIELDSTLQYLLKKARFNAVPSWESDDAGFKVPDWWPGVSQLRKNGIYRYKAVVPRSKEMTLLDDRIGVPKLARSRRYNPDGLIVSITRGDWVDGVAPIRQDRSQAVIHVRRCALDWHIPPVSELRGFLKQEGSRFWREQLAWDLKRRQATGPFAGPVEGRRCDTVFWSLTSK